MRKLESLRIYGSGTFLRPQNRNYFEEVPVFDIRTVAVPIWVKQGIDAWIAAAQIENGRLLRPLSKSGKIVGDELTESKLLFGPQSLRWIG